MGNIGVVVVVVVAIFAAAMLGAWLRGGGPKSDIKAVQEEMQRLLTAQAQGIASQLGQVSQVLTQQMSEVKSGLEQSVATTGRITSDAQREMTEQLRNSTDVVTRLNQQLGQAQQSEQELTEAAKTIKAALGGPKSAGTLGQTQLEDVITDALPASAYELDYRFSNGATASAVVRTGRKQVAVDAEFPMAVFVGAGEKGEGDGNELAQQAREHVNRIADTLILPEEGTLDVALLFVPSEGALLELLRAEDGLGKLGDYCREKHVLPVSPNSLLAYLAAVRAGLRGMESEEKVGRIVASLDGAKEQFGQFARLHEEFGRQLEQSVKTHQEAGRQLNQSLAALGSVAASDAGEETSGREAGHPVPVAASNNGA